MSDLILESNRSSVILSSLAKAEVKDVSYDMLPSYPILTKRHQLITKNGSLAADPVGGQEVTFLINKSMLWRGAIVEHRYTPGANIPATVFPGITLVDYIQIKSNNKVLFNISGQAYRGWLENQPESVKTMAFKMAMPLVPTTELPKIDAGAVPLVSYTMIPCSFFDAVMSNFDLNFYEQISVVVKYVSSFNVANIPTSATLTDSKLWIFLWRPDDKYYDMLRSKNQNPSKPLNMLTWNTYTETFTPASGSTSNEVRLNCNYPVFKSVVRIVPLLTNVTDGAYVNGVNVPIQTLKFSIGGNEVLTNIPVSISAFEKSAYGGASCLIPLIVGAAGVTMGIDQNQGVTLDFGMEPNNWVSNSGAVSFSQLNYPTITVTHTALTTGTQYQILVTHFYWNIMTLQSNNGSVQISVAN